MTGTPVIRFGVGLKRNKTFNKNFGISNVLTGGIMWGENIPKDKSPRSVDLYVQSIGMFAGPGKHCLCVITVINVTSNVGEVVFDLTSGMGTSMMAAFHVGCPWFGCVPNEAEWASEWIKRMLLIKSPEYIERYVCIVHIIVYIHDHVHIT
jgi:hypothetical protein